MQPAGQFVILYMFAMMVVSLLLMWGIRYQFSTSFFLNKMIWFSFNQEGHKRLNAPVDGWDVLCFAFPGGTTE